MINRALKIIREMITTDDPIDMLYKVESYLTINTKINSR